MTMTCEHCNQTMTEQPIIVMRGDCESLYSSRWPKQVFCSELCTITALRYQRRYSKHDPATVDAVA